MSKSRAMKQHVKPGKKPFAKALLELVDVALTKEKAGVKENAFALHDPVDDPQSERFEACPDPDLWRFAWTVLANAVPKYDSDGFYRVLDALSLQMTEAILEQECGMKLPDDSWTPPPKYTEGN